MSANVAPNMQPNNARLSPKFERFTVYCCTKCDAMLYGHVKMPKECPECEQE